MSSATAARREPRPPRARLHLTGTGGWALLTCLAVAAAAANTANNLLYLLLALLMAACPVSAWLSRRALLGLRGELVAPADLRAGRPADVVAEVAAAAPGASGLVLELLARDVAALTATTRASSAMACLLPGTSASVALPASMQRRGPARLRLIARSPFPFGLIEGERLLDETDVLVLPVPDPAWRRALELGTSEGEPALRKGSGTEILNIREHAHGDDARRIDWKATARLGKPMVREFAKEQQRAAVLVVTPEAITAGRQARKYDPALEAAISRAAGAIEDLTREGWRLRLLAPGMDVRGDERALLRALAVIQPKDGASRGWWAGQVEPGDTVLEFVPGSP